MFLLSDRTIIEVSGENRHDFLQSLITNDIKLANSQNLIYTAFLNASGRFFTDFFIFENDQKYFLDCHNSCGDDLIKKFNLYKLRSQIEVKKNNDLKVIFNLENLGFRDPRCKDFGWRLYLNSLELSKYQTQSEALYHKRRIDFKIPEGYYDLIVDKSYISEFDFDNLNAVSYNKGCYLGQETTARNHYRGVVRKKIAHFVIDNISSDLLDFINLNSLQIEDEFLKLVNIKGVEIFAKNSENNSQEIGIILSAILDKKLLSLSGLALMKSPEFNAQDLSDDFKNNFNKSSENLIFQDRKFFRAINFNQ